MGGDYSRQRFDPRKDFSAVLMQQGRVQLDSDWNELAAVLDRRWRAETIDIIGRCTVPKETPDGFRITIAGNNTLEIGRGRMYVDGLLAENHGKAPLEFDPVLAEERGAAKTILYHEQPYLPDALNVAPLRPDGKCLAYLDVWKREVTGLEDSELVEKAVGVDTTTRLQTVWQVKVLPNVGEGVRCDTPDLKAWDSLTAPSTGRLSTAAVGVPTSDELCTIPPSGGYRGAENQLYRVEIHNGGEAGTATFKWSRDNASVVASVVDIPSLNKLTVGSVGRDSELRFKVGDWVEITDDRLEFAGQPGIDPQPPGVPGVMAQIQNVDDATRVVTLTEDLPIDVFQTGIPDPAIHRRMRKWDQQGEVRDVDRNVVFNIDAAGTGVIDVLADTPMILEAGVQITFERGTYRPGDYWIFAARTADASVERLDKAPPGGIHHHFCRLALVTFNPESVTDCRTLWPPDFGGEGCECTVCVSADSHNSGALTIQQAVDRVKATGGKVCLDAGNYTLGNDPVRVEGAQSVSLTGQGWRTLLVYSGSGSAIRLESSLGITVEDLAVLMSGDVADGGSNLALRNCAWVTLQRCRFFQTQGSNTLSLAVRLDGLVVYTVVRENVISAAVGIGNVDLSAGPTRLATRGLYLQDNSLFCQRRGISLERSSLHYEETRVSGNLVRGTSEAGIVAVGVALPGSGIEIHGNEVLTEGEGLVIGTDGARISQNDISALEPGGGRNGIVLTLRAHREAIERCHIAENRVMGLAGHGIVVESKIGSATIVQNMVESVGGSGIFMDINSGAEVLSIESNQLVNLAPQTGIPVFGIRLLNTTHAELSSNIISGVGRRAVKIPCWGIQIINSSSVRIADNEVLDVGPDEFVNASVGVDILGPFDRMDLVDNVVRRRVQIPDTPGDSNWHAIRIGTPAAGITSVDELISVITLGDSIFGFFGSRLLRLPRGREIVSVRGNLLEAHGDVSAVEITGLGALVFNENRCLLTSKRSPVVARIKAGAVIATGNYVEGVKNIAAMDIELGQGRPFTALGNITSGPITVNGDALSDPWAPLNVIAA